MVRTVVLLKDVVDLQELKIDPITRQPLIDGMKRRLGDLDKRALELAINLKEVHGGEIIALSMGTSKTKTALLEALAMGADSAIIVNEESLIGIDSLATSIVLKAVLEKISEYDLIICGEMSLDSLSAQMGSRLSKLLDLPHMAYVKKVSLEKDTLRAVRDLEDVDEVVEVNLPALVSVVREINEPRIPSLRNIMGAKRKPVNDIDIASLGLSVEGIRAISSIILLNIEAPIVERKQIHIQAESVEETAEKLAEALLNEGVMEN